MRHVFHILEINHLSADGTVLWRAENLPNTFHFSGEEFLLRAAFLGGKKDNHYIPVMYYFGLDSRGKVSAKDTMDSIQNSGHEPSGGGYQRATVPSFAQFEMIQEKKDWASLSPVLYFVANDDNWPKVKNVFVTDQNGYGGFLIATVTLPSPTQLRKGQSMSLRMGIKLSGGDTQSEAEAPQTESESVDNSSSES